MPQMIIDRRNVCLKGHLFYLTASRRIFGPWKPTATERNWNSLKTLTLGLFFFVDNFQMVGVNVDRIVGSKNCHVQQ